MAGNRDSGRVFLSTLRVVSHLLQGTSGTYPPFFFSSNNSFFPFPSARRDPTIVNHTLHHLCGIRLLHLLPPSSIQSFLCPSPIWTFGVFMVHVDFFLRGGAVFVNLAALPVILAAIILPVDLLRSNGPRIFRSGSDFSTGPFIFGDNRLFSFFCEIFDGLRPFFFRVSVRPPLTGVDSRVFSFLECFSTVRAPPIPLVRTLYRFPLPTSPLSFSCRVPLLFRSSPANRSFPLSAFSCPSFALPSFATG